MPYKPDPKIKKKPFDNKPTYNNKAYNTTAWRKLRATVLQNYPICNDCKRAPSTVADHITPVRLGGQMWHGQNLQGLCTSCHNRKSSLESKLK